MIRVHTLMKWLRMIEKPHLSKKHKMDRDRPSHTLPPDHKTHRNTSVSNSVANVSKEKTIGTPDFPIGRDSQTSKRASVPIELIARDNSLGGLKPGSSSRTGGTNPYHTSAIAPRTLLQDHPKPYFYRRT